MDADDDSLIDEGHFNEPIERFVDLPLSAETGFFWKQEISAGVHVDHRVLLERVFTGARTRINANLQRTPQKLALERVVVDDPAALAFVEVHVPRVVVGSITSLLAQTGQWKEQESQTQGLTLRLGGAGGDLEVESGDLRIHVHGLGVPLLIVRSPRVSTSEIRRIRSVRCCRFRKELGTIV